MATRLSTLLLFVLNSTLAAAPNEKKEEPKDEPVEKTKVVRNAEYNRQVLQARVNLDFKDAKVADVIEKLSKDHRANFVFDKAEFERRMEKSPDFTVTVKLEDVLLGSGIQTMFESYGLVPVIVGDTIYITTPYGGSQKQRIQQVNCQFEKTPLHQAFAELTREFGLLIKLDPRTKEDRSADTPITMTFHNTNLIHVVDQMVDAAGLKMRYLETMIHVVPIGTDERARYLAEALDKPISDIQKGEVALPFLLELLTDLVNPPGANQNPDLRVPITLDVDAFRRQTEGMFDPERVQIKFPTKLIGTSLREILKIIGDQLDAVPMVRKDFIEFIPRAIACKELKITADKDEPFPTLVHRFYHKTPLEKALAQISETYNQNVVLSPLAEAKKDFPITARMVNVPLDSAVETLAAMADLQVVRKANVLYVTTKEQASEMNAKLKKKEGEKKPAPVEGKKEK